MWGVKVTGISVSDPWQTADHSSMGGRVCAHTIFAHPSPPPPQSYVFL